MLAKGEALPLAANGCSDAMRYRQKSAEAIVPGNLSIFFLEIRLKKKKRGEGLNVRMRERSTMFYIQSVSKAQPRKRTTCLRIGGTRK